MAAGNKTGTHFAPAARWSVALVLTAFLVSTAADQSLAASLQRIDAFGPNPGQLNMHVYVPESHRPKSALVLALHGCVQKASSFDDETGLKALADTLKFVLLFPEQRKENNDKRCFNWFQRKNNKKHRGESGSIRSMIQYAIDTYQVDASKIFILGLSAGGSMTAVLMANYPELFQGGAIIAGTPYGCNNPSFFTWVPWWWLRMWYGDAAAASYACGLLNFAPTRRSPRVWGDFVRASSGVTPGRWPKLSLWQGETDDVVSPANQRELVKQWTNVLGIDQTPDKINVLDDITHQVYHDASDTPRLETYQIADFDHAIAINPGQGPDHCGVIAPYVKNANICTSRKILEFWGMAP